MTRKDQTLNPVNSRRKIDKGWRYYKGEALEAVHEAFDDSGWESVDLPHDWSMDGPFDPNNFIDAKLISNHLEGRADSYLPKGIGWYRKRLLLPAADPLANFYLEFEGVFRNSTLWVNGRQVGVHASGYDGVVYDITPFLQRSAADQQLVVRVDAREMEGWWYEGSGIYRHVWLASAPQAHITPWGLAVSTPRVTPSSATVQIKTAVKNSGDINRRCRLLTTIIDPDGKVAGRLETEQTIAGQTELTFLQTHDVSQPRLWSPRQPYLYTLHADLVSEEEGTTDHRETTFGIRWFEFTADRGFFLNGQPLQLRGGCIHHDFGGLGTALPDRAHQKTVEVLKEMGGNIIRSSHNAAAPALMDACDRLGMLFWAETRYLGSSPQTVESLRKLIQRDGNHPSVIVWSLANIAGGPNGELTEALRLLNKTAHETDPFRPTAVALEGNADANANGFARVTDVVGYNGGGMGIDDRDHRLFPERKILISEFSSGRGARGVYAESPARSAEQETLGDGRVMKRGGNYASVFNLCLAHEREWRHVDERPWLAGGIMWSAIEYWGETTGWPIVTSQFGVLDICRFPKDIFYFYQKEWTDQPVLHLFPHWTWPGREGQPIEIWCYTNCETVDLYLDGTLQRGIPSFLQYQASWPHLSWVVPYRAGTLVAVGKNGGNVVCRQEIKTAGKPAQIRLVPDKTQLRADGEDISFITISLHDAQGVFVPVAGNSLAVAVEGNGRLLGLCSGDPGSHEAAKGSRMRAFNGLCLAIVQSAEQAGEIQVAVSSPGLESGRVILDAFT